MAYRIIIPRILVINKNWLLENLGGPIRYIPFPNGKIIKLNLYIGPNWAVFHNLSNHHWITIGEFEKEEDATLFKLRWV